VTFKYGLGSEFIEVLSVLHKLGLDRTDPCASAGSRSAPRDVVAACLPDPATLGRPDERQDLRRHVGQGHRQRTASRARCTSTTSSTTPTRCATTARRPSCGRRPSTRSWPSSSSPAVRWSGPGPRPRGPSTRCPSSSCSTDYGSPWGLREM
jgi:hypothetical protein